MQEELLTPPRTSCLKVHARTSLPSFREGSKLSASAAQAFNAGFETAFNGGDEIRDNNYEEGSDEFYSFNDGFAYWFEHESEVRKDRAHSRHLQLMFKLGDDPVLARLERMPIDRVGALIGIPVEHWPGKCYEVACAMIQAFRWGARAAPVYGLFKGHISSECTLFSGMARHGWIQLQDGRMVDPTRWVFRAKAPVIEVFVPGSDAFDQAREDYDEGAQALAAFSTLPEMDSRQPAHTLPKFLQEIWSRVTIEVCPPETASVNQLAWLVRTAASRVTIHESIELCAWYERQGLDGLVPVDLLARVTRLKRWGPDCLEALSE